MRLLLILFIALQTIGCEKKNDNGEFPELEFRYDKDLLLPLTHFKDLSLSIPLNFEEVLGDKYQSIKKKLEGNSDSYFDKNILAIFQHQDGHVLIISTINDLKNIYGRLNKDFELGLIELLGASETNRGQFVINNIETVQFITINEDIINYKLFYDVIKKACFQIDYFVPINKFVTFQPSMESSISTFKIKK